MALEALRTKGLINAKEPVTYAGRLDPMAEGVLLVLTGETRFEKPRWIKLSKVYEAEVLFGVETDSYDVLGRIESVKLDPLPSEAQVETGLNRLMGEVTLPFPPYSGYRLKGKALHEWAQRGELDPASIPLKSMQVFEMRVLGAERYSLGVLAKEAVPRINAVSGAFRQKEVAEDWVGLLERMKPALVVRVRWHVGSGTYIRSLAHELGKQMGCGALLWSLKRTSVSTWTSEEALRLV